MKICNKCDNINYWDKIKYLYQSDDDDTSISSHLFIYKYNTKRGGGL